MPWATSSAAAGAKAIASLASRLCGVAGAARHGRVLRGGRGRGRRDGRLLRLPQEAAGRAHAEARGTAQHGLAVGVQRVVAPDRARPEVRRAGIEGDLGRRGRNLVVGIVHAVGRVPGRPAPDAPRPAEALVAGGIHTTRGLVRAGLELHRAEHSARVRTVGARVATVARLDRADRGQQLPGHAVAAAPLLVQRQVVAGNARDGRGPRHARRAGGLRARRSSDGAYGQHQTHPRRETSSHSSCFRQRASPT